jgi:hypothetical protein
MVTAAPPRIYFHHIKKTAGNSLRKFLIDHVGERNVSPMLRGGKYRDALLEYGRYAVISGHLAPLPGDRLPADRTTITLLRDPIDRALSQFVAFLLRNVHGLNLTPVVDQAREFSAWLEAMRPEELDMLNGHVQALWPFGWTAQSIPDPSHMVGAACDALDAFDVVGLQHSLHDALTAVARRVGWPPPTEVPRENVTTERLAAEQLPPSTLARLRRALEADYELYAHALRRAATPARTTSLGNRDASPPRGHPHDTFDAGPTQETHAPTAHDARSGSGEIVVTGIDVRGTVSDAQGLRTGEWVTIDVRFHASIGENDLTAGMAIRDHDGVLVFGTNTRLLGDVLAVTPGDYAVTFRIFNVLGPGRYAVTVTLHRGPSHLEKCYDWFENAASFEVVDRIGDYFEGRVRLDVKANVVALSPEANVTWEPAASTPDVAVLGQRNPELREFSAEISAHAVMEELPRASDLTVRMTFRNSGSQAWPALGRRAVRVAYHWLDQHGDIIEFEGLRTPLPHDLAPGESVTLACFVRTPESPGALRLRWTLIQEDVAWFDARDAQSALDCDMTVTDSKSNAPDAPSELSQD